MKKLLFAIVLTLNTLAPIHALASGKVMLEPTYSLKAEKLGGQGGISVYEHLFLGFHYNQWTGAGYKPRVFEDGTFWFASKHDLEYWFGRFSISPGYKFEYNNADTGLATGSEHSVHVKLTYKLW